MKTYYCWKCGCDAPFLEEDEWTTFEPYATETVKAIKDYRKETGAGLAEAKAAVEDTTVERFLKLTGFRLPSWESARHHRLSSWGPECPGCGHQIRTDRASFCANCGRPTGFKHADE